MAINLLTTPDASEKIEALLAVFQYVDDDRIVVTTGFVSSFCFWGGHVTAKRQALVECVEAFESAYGAEVKWACYADTWKTKKT